MNNIRTCDRCAQSYEAVRDWQRFCSLACRAAHETDERRHAIAALRASSGQPYYGRETSTYAERAAHDLTLESQGRFASETVVRPATDTPLPAPAWSKDNSGTEPSLGYSIDETPDLGMSYDRRP
jgi:hypothetical protein